MNIVQLWWENDRCQYIHILWLYYVYMIHSLKLRALKHYIMIHNQQHWTDQHIGQLNATFMDFEKWSFLIGLKLSSKAPVPMRHVPVLAHGGSHGSTQVDPPCNNGKVTLVEKKCFSRDEHHQIYKPCEYNMEGGASMTSFFGRGGGSHFSASTFDGKKIGHMNFDPDHGWFYSIYPKKHPTQPLFLSNFH